MSEEKPTLEYGNPKLRRRRIWSAILAHVLASYAFVAISSIVVVFQLGLDNAKSVFLGNLNLWTVAAPLTLPVGLAVGSEFYLKGSISLWSILEAWAQYLIPLAVIYALLRRGVRKRANVDQRFCRPSMS